MGKKSRKKVFFEDDTNHGLVKRVMFKKYFQSYIGKTQNFQNENFMFDTVFIDGFAGEGRYSKEWPREIEKYGSPLISLMVVLEYFYKRNMKTQKKDYEVDVETVKASRSKSLEDKYQGKNDNGEAKLYAKTSPGKHTEMKKTDQKAMKAKENNIWGWQASELDPEAELVVELENKNNRSTYFNGHARITLIFIEKDRKSYQKLAANVELLIIKFLARHFPDCQYGFLQGEGSILLDMKTAPFSLNIEIINKQFVDTKPPSMLKEKAVRSLTFLDPFGFTQTPMSHVQLYAPGPGNEILINFMSSFVNRQVSRCPEGVAEQFGISDYEAVAKHYGINPPDLKREDGLADFVKNVIHSCEPDREHESRNNINKCAQNYETFLKRKTKCEFSLIFEIKNKMNSTFFHMVHVTHHMKGLEAMKESMNRCSQKEGEMVMSDYDIVCNGQELNLGNMDDPSKVAEAIFDEFRGQKRITMDRIYDHILLKTNYLFRTTPLGKLQRLQKMTAEREDGKSQKTKYKYPKTDNDTKKPITWLFSFSNEDNINECSYDTDIDTKKVTGKRRTSKPRKEKNNTVNKASSKIFNKEQNVMPKMKITKDKKKLCTQKDNLGDDEYRRKPTNNNGAELEGRIKVTDGVNEQRKIKAKKDGQKVPKSYNKDKKVVPKKITKQRRKSSTQTTFSLADEDAEPTNDFDAETKRRKKKRKLSVTENITTLKKVRYNAQN